VRTASKSVETLIYYQKRSECIGGASLPCNIVVHDNIYEPALIEIHGVTFLRQVKCSMEIKIQVVKNPDAPAGGSGFGGFSYSLSPVDQNL
jgi:hypothetical protein